MGKRMKRKKEEKNSRSMYIRNSKENKEIAHKGNKNNQKYTRIRSINYRKKKNSCRNSKYRRQVMNRG